MSMGYICDCCHQDVADEDAVNDRYGYDTLCPDCLSQLEEETRDEEGDPPAAGTPADVFPWYQA